MATDGGHAAGQTERSFTVRLHAAHRPPTDLADGFPDLFSAVDFAVDWLNREDPARDGDARLAILETRDGQPAEVWTYPPSQQESAGQELVKLFGFNPAAWQPRAAETPADARQGPSRRPIGAGGPPPRQSDQPGENAGATGSIRVAPPVAPAPITVPADLDTADGDAAERSAWAAARRWIVATGRLTWEDRASRCCLIVAVVAVWLSLALADPLFLIILLASTSGLWVLHHRRPAPTTDPDDWL